jgi:hypothetical protein
VVNHLISTESANAGVAESKTFSVAPKYVRFRHIVEHLKENTIYIEKSSWIRAKCSGLLHDHNT